VLIRLELVGPATACLMADLERLPSPAAPVPATSPNATFIKGTGVTGTMSHLSWLGQKLCHHQRDVEKDQCQIIQAPIK